MRIVNATWEELEEAAKVAGAVPVNQSQDPKRVVFRPGPDGTEFRTVNPISGRRANAICFHGHGRIFRRLFELAPEAKVRSALADYDAENFERRAKEIAFKNAGSPMYPYTFADACECRYSGTGWFGDVSGGGE